MKLFLVVILLCSQLFSITHQKLSTIPAFSHQHILKHNTPIHEHQHVEHLEQWFFLNSSLLFEEQENKAAFLLDKHLLLEAFKETPFKPPIL